jgi:phosphoesterase RecJ-like protein
VKKTTVLKKASQLIRPARRPLLICHIGPDGDAIGSLTGLGLALRRLGKEPILACADSIPERFRFIPGIEAVVQQVNDEFDLVISLDASDLKRLGHFPQMPTFGPTPLLNIDHHLTNLDFGTVNLVDSHASSASEVVLELIEYLGVPIDTDIATCLLTGIVTDTRGFRTSNVTIQVMEAALRLMKAGASLPSITHHGLNRRSTSVILLWRAALTRLQIEDRMIWTSIPMEMRRGVGYTGNGDAGLVSFLVSADDVDVAAVFVEGEDGRVDVGLRAVPGFDVAHVALELGGGGHALAAGCSLRGPLEEAEMRTLIALRADLARQRQARDGQEYA